MSRRASLVEESQNRLLELGYCGRCGNDRPAEPQREAKAEAPTVSNPNEFLDLVVALISLPKIHGWSVSYTPLGLGDLPFVVGRMPVAGEELPALEPHLQLADATPFRPSRDHFMIEKPDGSFICATSAALLERSSWRAHRQSFPHR